jgi:hypothetical protein
MSACPTNASLCQYNTIQNKTTVLAYVNQMHMQIKNDANSIEMIFNNTNLPCKPNGKTYSTITYIEFTCGHTLIGRPQATNPEKIFKHGNDNEHMDRPIYLQNVPDECIYTFEWRTAFACKKLSDHSQISLVNITNGVLSDPSRQISINLSSILLNETGFVDEINPSQKDNQAFKYYINFNNKYASKDCNKSIVCQIDEKASKYFEIGSVVEYYSFDAFSEILEISLRSTVNKCQANEDQVRALVRIYCDPNKSGVVFNDSFKFETESDKCMYIFDWPTKLLCVKSHLENVTNSSTNVMTTTRVDTTTTKRDQTDQGLNFDRFS